MKSDHDIFRMSKEALAESDRRALAAIAAGRGVPHELVAEWLSRWGTPEETPVPAEWLE
jgi:predicted transcriptional regulator